MFPDLVLLDPRLVPLLLEHYQFPGLGPLVPLPLVPLPLVPLSDLALRAPLPPESSDLVHRDPQVLLGPLVSLLLEPLPLASLESPTQVLLDPLEPLPLAPIFLEPLLLVSPDQVLLAPLEPLPLVPLEPLLLGYN